MEEEIGVAKDPRRPVDHKLHGAGLVAAARALELEAPRHQGAVVLMRVDAGPCAEVDLEAHLAGLDDVEAAAGLARAEEGVAHGRQVAGLEERHDLGCHVVVVDFPGQDGGREVEMRFQDLMHTARHNTSHSSGGIGVALDWPYRTLHQMA